MENQEALSRLRPFSLEMGMNPVITCYFPKQTILFLFEWWAQSLYLLQYRAGFLITVVVSCSPNIFFWVIHFSFRRAAFWCWSPMPCSIFPCNEFADAKFFKSGLEVQCPVPHRCAVYDAHFGFLFIGVWSRKKWVRSLIYCKWSALLCEVRDNGRHLFPYGVFEMRCSFVRKICGQNKFCGLLWGCGFQE